MINQLEIQAAWNTLVESWKDVWLASDAPERWTAFMSHCDRLLTLARADGIAELETALGPLLDILARLRKPGPDDKARVDALLPPIYAIVCEVCSEDYGQAAATRGNPANLPLIVILAREATTLRGLLQITHYGYEVRVFEDYRAGTQFAIVESAVAVLVDIDHELSAETLAYVADIRRFDIKWFALAERDDFALRLQAVRASAAGFLLAPPSVDTLLDAVEPLTLGDKDEPYRVLALDASEDVLATIRTALSASHDVIFSTLHGPETVLGALLDFSPDVLLLDFQMNGCTGPEIAKIVRQDKANESIPIVYLTQATDDAAQLAALRDSGDDFLTKPLDEIQLVNMVINRARRYRSLRRFMVEDKLTGLYNHLETKTLLQQALLFAERQNLSVSYAVLDIDHFKRIVDSHGHTTGDGVIKTLARLLRQRVRRADVVGRYGGEAFVVVMFDSEPVGARERIDRIRQDFAELDHAGKDGNFAATFSAGLAHYPAYASMMELMIATDAALQAAKHAGRNCVVAAERSSA